MFKSIYVLILVFVNIVFVTFNASAMICATSESIKDLSKKEAIDLAYEGSLRVGNFAFEPFVYLEMETYGGLVFEDKDNTSGNLEILEKYEFLNNKVAQWLGGEPVSSESSYKGIFKISYDASGRNCRRQIMISDVIRDASGVFFTGAINVEVCSPVARQLFKKARQSFDVNDEKMDSIEKFIGYLESLESSGELDPTQRQSVSNAKNILNPNGDSNIYYAIDESGHIAPRFSVKINKLYFDYKVKGDFSPWGEESEEYCVLNVSSTDYAGVLENESHVFSEEHQVQAFATLSEQVNQVNLNPGLLKDQFWYNSSFYLSFYNNAGEVSLSPAVLNKSLETIEE